MNTRVVVLLVGWLIGAHVAWSAEESRTFEPERWPSGVHLLAGSGVNSSLYFSETERRDFGAGLNFKTDVGYYLNDRWAFELGSSVKFNDVDQILVWDTLFTVGARYRLPWLAILETRSMYLRLFVGRAPTVIYAPELSGPFASESDDEGDETRVHFDGNVVGGSLGWFTKGWVGKTWFFEATASLQHLDQKQTVEMDGVVPVVIAEGAASDSSMIYSLYAAIGVVFF